MTRSTTWRGFATFTVVTSVLLAACGGGSSDDATDNRSRSSSPSTTTATSTPSTTAALSRCDTAPTPPTGSAGQSAYVNNADVATALAFAPDGRLFFAERTGAIKIASGGQVTAFTTVPTVTTERGGGYSERGLLGLALSPNFATDHYVYAFYSRTDFETQVVVRFTECAGVASEPQTLITLPSGNDCCHKGGRIKFGPDARLYVSLGEQHAVTAGSVNRTDSIPQDPTDVRGKILRYNADGTVPADNPFGAGNPVWATGFRNVYGIAFGNGQTFVTSNGPTGDLGLNRGNDLAFVITAGGQYQWPACYGYSHLTPGATSCLDRPEPDWSSESETVVPTGATWVDARGPGEFAGHFVFCTYNSGMRVFTPGAPHATVANGPAQCQFDVIQGPDGALYFSDSGTIYRLA